MKTSLILLIAILLQGCSFRPASYQVSSANQQLLSSVANKMTVVNEETDIHNLDSIACRAAGSVSLANDEPFVEYVVRALKDELKSANKLDENGKKLHVKITRINFSSRMGATNWYIDAEYRIDDKKMTVSTVYNDRSSFAAVAACNNVAQYFSKAVEQHLTQLYQNPTFQSVTGFSHKKTVTTSNIEDKLRQLNKLHREGLISDDEFATKKEQLLSKL